MPDAVPTLPTPLDPITTEFDVAIVGGGPAGLSAAIWLARYLRSVVLIDAGDPRNWETRGVNGFLGHPKIRPPELRKLGRDECRAHGVTLIDAVVERVHKEHDDRFVLTVEGEVELVGRRLLLAIGLKDVWPRIEGLRHVYGSTAHVCPDCDGFETRDKKTAVIGKGRKAVGMALSLANWTSNLIICTNGEPAELDEAEYCEKLDALNIPVLTDRLTWVESSDGQVHALRLENGLELDVEEIFFAIGQRPADDLGAQLGCDRDDDGHVLVDDHYHTSVYNAFAAGDIVPGPQLAIAAASDGAMAALSIHKSLTPKERKLEKQPTAMVG